MIKTTKTYRATAKDVALCARAHLSDGDQAAANDVCNVYAYGPVDANGYHARHFADPSSCARIGQLRRRGIVFCGADWTSLHLEDGPVAITPEHRRFLGTCRRPAACACPDCTARAAFLADEGGECA